jgi:hypothetical protein
MQCQKQSAAQAEAVLAFRVLRRVLRSAVIGCDHDGVGAIVEVVDLMLSRLTRISAGTQQRRGTQRAKERWIAAASYAIQPRVDARTRCRVENSPARERMKVSNAVYQRPCFLWGCT